MFELFKKRTFSDYISDTIGFFKTFGKHYFRNFFIITGIFLILLLVAVYFVFNVMMDMFFGQLTNPGSVKADYMADFLNTNPVLVSSVFIGLTLLTLLLSMISTTFPVIYMKLVEIHKGNKFTTQDIITEFKSTAGRIFIYFTGSIFIIIPLMGVIFVILAFLSIIIIGIPLMLIILPVFLSWIALSYFDYITLRSGFFQSLTNAKDLIRNQFWVIVLTTLIAVIVIQMLQSVITFIPYVVGLLLFFISGAQETGPTTEMYSFMSVFIAIIMVIGILLAYIFNNLLIVNQGLIYYSRREDHENNSAKMQIDNIGSDFE